MTNMDEILPEIAKLSQSPPPSNSGALIDSSAVEERMKGYFSQSTSKAEALFRGDLLTR